MNQKSLTKGGQLNYTMYTSKAPKNKTPPHVFESLKPLAMTLVKRLNPFTIAPKTIR